MVIRLITLAARQQLLLITRHPRSVIQPNLPVHQPSLLRNSPKYSHNRSVPTLVRTLSTSSPSTISPYHNPITFDPTAMPGRWSIGVSIVMHPRSISYDGVCIGNSKPISRSDEYVDNFGFDISVE